MLIEDVDDDRPDACFSVVFRDCRQISLYENRRVAQGFEGWATVLCTHSAHYGRWYWEVDVIEAPDDTALRVGAGIRYCRYDMPLGYNDFSYALQSHKVFHKAKHQDVGAELVPGTTVGVFLQLPCPDFIEKDPSLDLARAPFAANGTVGDPDKPPKAVRHSQPSRLDFSVNGVLCAAVEGLTQGTYHPGVSLFGKAKVLLRTEPPFKFGLGVDAFQPVCAMRQGIC
ncbi:MAG: uncharacterized protein KVP18_004835 [Porospora cf. gigantea A]|uniref:uncharacterized protein n=1 Tax=Porospora cf. gigantea A TaxID=2853593 RepID=UPI00355AC0D8|nr:MAG: hypothetical protein KVP18_004835 [Porospora cf. gigantea A]